MKKKYVLFAIAAISILQVSAQKKLYTEQYRHNFIFRLQPTGAMIPMVWCIITARIIYFTSTIHLATAGGT